MALDTIDLLILKALALAPLHGYGIGQRIEQVSEACSASRLAPSIPPCNGWNATGTSRARGPRPRTTAAHATTR